ncbi:MAG: AraC family transcriptional regulator [Aquamicrobium sp.]|jgi:AraC family transcriptional regulator|uniref:AraC family transcriptional regulator n=1 Tax=Mesorhizobium sp. Pch-S TaxID=2082387 RepID=UPI001010D781|nr:AraC family transcriptional regulator [Mesorhizobium sp. Pch-S]MBR2688178.1 AraC family transcriptional regulator [Aquamicrobium sp.]QAZ46023.1 AraC family transcriptional regulator [Mesorhizobium sp. Pch-S]
MSIVDRALWVMERNSEHALGLNNIADACGVSRSHLANAFGTATGWPVMRYLRARRLTEAAGRLAGGASDILTIALEHGYGSHEAFTRAFREQFNLSPEQVRDRGSVDGLATTPPLQLRNGNVLSPSPQLKTLGALKLVGLAAPCSFGESIHIPAQWQRFMSTYSDTIPNKVKMPPIGMCEVPDDDGGFRYVCAVAVKAFEDRLPELEYFETEHRTYAVFAHNDHVSTIFDTYLAVWNEALPRLARKVADSPVLEFHNSSFDPDTGFGGLEIYIPLQDHSGA